MSLASQTAVELTRSDDSLELWVDANNNGVRDDDDVNIYVTAGGGFYTVSPTFKHPLDTGLQQQIRECAIALLAGSIADTQAEETLCELALELVVKATTEADSAPDSDA